MDMMTRGLEAIDAGREMVDQLAAARRQAVQPITTEEVAGLLRDIVSSLDGDMTAGDLKVYHELEDLAHYIQQARAEIAAVRPDEIRSSHIPTATDELDAVVGATEAATNTIMDACDAIAQIADRLGPADNAALTEAVTRVFEACNFQDVTGQRITKVVRALKHIEAKIDQLIAIFGDSGIGSGAPGPVAEPTPTQDPDAHLVHGPSLPGEAIDQDEIDRLLASFD